MKKHIFAALCSLLCLPACFGSIGGVGEPEPLAPAPLEPPANFQRPSGLEDSSAYILESSLEGQVGDVLAGENQYVFRAMMDDSFFEVDLRAQGESGALMNHLMVEGLDAMELGRTYRFGIEPSDSSLFAVMIACSGPRDGDWDFDVPVNDVEVRLEEGEEEGTVELFYEASAEGETSTSGHLVLRR